MADHPISHPTESTLSSYGLGKLDDASSKLVNQHLESCPECRLRVAELSSDSFLGRLRDAQAHSRPNSPAPAMSATDGLSLLAGGDSRESAPPPASSLPPGLAAHPDYEILRELGQGGMAIVYLAQNKLMGRVEVLKVVSSKLVNRQGVLDRFLGEIRNAAKLHHPNVVTAYSAMRAGESFILAMEYVAGLDLAQLVKARGALPVAHACNYIHQAALGLQHAHEHGMVHRDIKPSNLMLSRQGNRALIKVLDFGLAKVKSEGTTDQALTHDGQMLGTPDFIAPEQIVNARAADIRADIYSLGCTFYYLLTGGPPFHAGSLYEVLQAHHSMEAMPLNLARPEVPIELAALVSRMMAKEPERRFQEPRQVAQALLPFFKRGATGSVGSKPDVSQAGQTNAGRLISMPTQSATDAGRSAARDEEFAKPPVAETRWESLIDVQKQELSKNPRQSINSDRRPPWKKWRIAIASSLFGLIVLGGIIIRILDNEGREVGTHNVPDDHTVVIEHPVGKGEIKSPEKGQGDTAGSGSAVPVAREAARPPVGKPLATSTDPVQPGTFWMGTSTVLFRSWTNEAAKPQALWLTIKARVGAQFRAVAESPRGWHDAEGTFNDGVIHWKVDKEILSWEGKLVGNELVGTLNGTNRQGDRSGEFRLTLANRPAPPGLQARFPPVGPVRSARWMIGDGWSVEGDQVIKEGLGDGSFGFGDPDWSDYDLTFQALKSAGPHGIGCGFHHNERKIYWLGFGGPDGTHSISHWNELTKEATWPHKRPGTIQTTIRLEEWYTVRVILRGQHIRVTLDDHLLFDVEDNFNQRGAIALRFFDSAGRFRKIKVTAPDGSVLWEGPPDLP
jgi:serine/threonine protein kinase